MTRAKFNKKCLFCRKLGAKCDLCQIKARGCIYCWNEDKECEICIMNREKYVNLKLVGKALEVIAQ